MDRNLSETSLLQHLENLALQLKIEVRYEDLSDKEIPIHSGGCKVSGRSLIIIDLRLPFIERARILAGELSQYDLESLYILPRVREFILLQKSAGDKKLAQR
jgi:hypothetical protein